MPASRDSYAVRHPSAEAVTIYHHEAYAAMKMIAIAPVKVKMAMIGVDGEADGGIAPPSM